MHVYCGLKASRDRIKGMKKTGCLGFINVAVGVLTGDRINEVFSIVAEMTR